MCELDGLRGKMYLRDGSKWFVHSGNGIRVSSQLHNHCPAIPLSCMGVVLNVVVSIWLFLWFLWVTQMSNFNVVPGLGFWVQRLRHRKNLWWTLYRVRVLPMCLCSPYLAAPLFSHQTREKFLKIFQKNRTLHGDGFPDPELIFLFHFFAWTGSLFVGVRAAGTAHLWVSQCGQALSMEWEKQEWKWGWGLGDEGEHCLIIENHKENVGNWVPPAVFN